MLTRMIPLERSYNIQQSDSGWERLVDDVCRLVERNPVPWEGLGTLDRAAIISLCRERSVVAVFGAIMDRYTLQQGASTWACKSMQYSTVVDELERYFGDPKYIYLHRDGRDVALSFLRAVVGDKHPYFTAKKWAELQRAAAAVAERVGPERCQRVCYEELTAEPEPVLRRLCGFLGVDFSPEMMSFHRSQEATRTSGKSKLWENLGKPIMRNNSRKFLRGFSEEQVRTIESIAGPELDRLGYERAYVEMGDEQVFSPEDIAVFAEDNALQKSKVRAQMDADDATRRAHQLAILTERVAFLDGFTQVQLRTLQTFLTEEHYAPNAVLIERQVTHRDLYFIVAGEAVVTDGATTVARLSVGACVGELGMLTGHPRTREVSAVTHLRVLRLRWPDYHSLLESQPRVAAQLLWATATRLAERFIEASE
jgi:hypothetical protein